MKKQFEVTFYQSYAYNVEIEVDDSATEEEQQEVAIEKAELYFQEDVYDTAYNEVIAEEVNEDL